MERKLSQPPVTTSTPRPRQNRTLLLKNFNDVSPILPGPNIVRKAKSSGMNKMEEKSPKVVKKPKSLIPIYKGSTDVTEPAIPCTVGSNQDKDSVQVNTNKGLVNPPDIPSNLQQVAVTNEGRKSKEKVDFTEIFREARIFMKEIKKSLSPGKPQNSSKTIQRPSVDVIPELIEENENQLPTEKSSSEMTFINPEDLDKLSNWPDSPISKKARISLKRKSNIAKTANKKLKTEPTTQEEKDGSIFGSPKVPNLVEFSSLAEKRKTYVLKKKSSSEVENKNSEKKPSVFSGITPLAVTTSNHTLTSPIEKILKKSDLYEVAKEISENKENQTDMKSDIHSTDSKKRTRKRSQGSQKTSKQILSSENERILNKERSVIDVKNEISSKATNVKEDKKTLKDKNFKLIEDKKNNSTKELQENEMQQNTELQCKNKECSVKDVSSDNKTYVINKNETVPKKKQGGKSLAISKGLNNSKCNRETANIIEENYEKPLKRNARRIKSKEKLENTNSEIVDTKNKRGRKPKKLNSANENNNPSGMNISHEVNGKKSQETKLDMILEEPDESQKEENEIIIVNDTTKLTNRRKNKVVNKPVLNSKKTKSKIPGEKIIELPGSEKGNNNTQGQEKIENEFSEKNNINDYVSLTQTFKNQSKCLEQVQNNQFIKPIKKSGRKKNPLPEGESLEKDNLNKSVSAPSSKHNDSKLKAKVKPPSKRGAAKNQKPSLKPVESSDSCALQMKEINDIDKVVPDCVEKKSNSRKVSRSRINRSEIITGQSESEVTEKRPDTKANNIEEEEDKLNHNPETSRTESCRKKRTPVAYWSNKKTSIYQSKDDINNSGDEQQARRPSKRQLKDYEKFDTQDLFGLKKVKIQRLRPGVEASVCLHVDDFVMAGWVEVEPGASISNISTNTTFLVEEGVATVKIGSHISTFGFDMERRGFFIPRMINASITNKESVKLRMAFTKFRGSRGN